MYCNIYAECIGQFHAESLVVDSVSVSPSEPRKVDSVRFFCGVLDTSGTCNSSSPSSAGFPEHHLSLGMGLCIWVSFWVEPL